jgi:natural product precursor
MKKLKKLQLQTEQLISLNDNEMFNLKGGDDGTQTTTATTSSYPCLYESATIAISLTASIYGYGEDNSLWTCPSPPASAIVEYGACKLPTVIITP